MHSALNVAMIVGLDYYRLEDWDFSLRKDNRRGINLDQVVTFPSSFEIFSSVSVN